MEGGGVPGSSCREAKLSIVAAEGSAVEGRKDDLAEGAECERGRRRGEGDDSLHARRHSQDLRDF
jgi:hypothetical protein